ncbi:L-tyrosine/L-tryptophan isonitrile synthase family protein [Paraburkholderia bryophila]|uniref:Pyoverdine/dityrosine biosynthesis protein Dit1 n=1 Tax=Paraburkholderia bryophila TaxID=420952 RepID=A0A7Z0B473_9BURK|nr:isocyanide synthase family protein [Paraburkholderia bryophila]NYH20358.1 pyoverdine/dityrosine biosynthesis protein Dit1 [Paraburkholderia bryophila]NYH20614.1 pyoverdine/dityrosine biosynthesis protein Dit1 [Paraburkholderia bryophila]
MPHDRNRLTSHAILEEIIQIVRWHPAQRTASEIRHDNQTIGAIQLPRIHAFVEANNPIELVLPAFPSKSPNLAKVLGRLPDLAERLSLTFLNTLCLRIQRHHPPGAQLKICSDGRVFGDLIRVDDRDISAYQSALQHIVAQSRADHLELYNLDHSNPRPAHTANFNEMRERLVDEYADPIDAIKQKLIGDPAGTQLYRAITRFLFEDGLTPHYRGSRTALQKDAKTRALGVIQRSWAWGALLADRFPNAIRLSIHPQPAASQKIGIHLMPTRDNWLTPWHGVAVERHGQFTLMKRRDAERLGGRIVMHDQQPSHYRIDPLHLANRYPPVPSDSRRHRASASANVIPTTKPEGQ